MQDMSADQSAQYALKGSFVQIRSERKKKSYLIGGIALFCCLVALTGCRHRVQQNPQPEPVPPKQYPSGSTRQSEARSPQWWLSFNDPLLSQYIEKALGANFTLKEGAARLKQTGLVAQQVDADQYPALDAGLQGNTDWEDNDLVFSERIGVTFSWEADLWGRLAAASQAAALDSQAEKEALAELSLALSLEVAQAYYELIEQSLLWDLIQRQIAVDTTSHDLVKLRFANGTVSSADVLQQEELLASVKAQLPPIQARLIVLRHRLHILQGRMPDSKVLPVAKVLPEIPPLPVLGIPADLLLHRPDLRKLGQEVAAADYRVAEAAAERLPSLKLGASAALSSGDLLLSIFAEALATVLDWDQRKNEVERRKAQVEEKMAAWAQAYLEAVEEVENFLSQEQEQGKLIIALQEQLRVAEALLEQTRNRYLHGVTDYLPVLTALVSVQKLERSLIRQQWEQLNSRLQLYHALGGSPVALHSFASLP
ncbi:MAG: efflux transporter outer membrane subunit [Candidatus Electrothrix sp. GW3-4]|uniref:efflux transporter outer membrane subunit n=1 Tax=Candidatus Electrothrix sp. GW3-4 TaxID=3126740 RepID=UPI0030CB6734